MNFERLPLIVTDGFEFYRKVIRRFFGPACLYGQVLKTRRNDRIIKVERRALHGAAWRFDDALNNSEDSSTLNTSFIERLNLTIRQSSAYLSRRTLSHARSTERLDEHLELLRCYYNFVRPHGALKFGREIRTPAMQARHGSGTGVRARERGAGKHARASLEEQPKRSAPRPAVSWRSPNRPKRRSGQPLYSAASPNVRSCAR